MKKCLCSQRNTKAHNSSECIECHHTKVGLIGTGMVGASFAYALMQSKISSELVMVDVNKERAEGEAMDLNHGMAFVTPMSLKSGTIEDLTCCEVIVITAGATQRTGEESRLDLLEKNVKIIKDIIPQVVKVAPDAVIVIATNPVDVLTSVAIKNAGLPPGQIFGSGTVLDTSRFRFLLSEYYNVDMRNIHAYIIGEHGDSELPVWSLANVAGVRLKDFVGPNGQKYDDKAMQDIYVNTRDAALKVIDRKKSTYYAIGLSLLKIVESILKDTRTVLTVSLPVPEYYGIDKDVAISTPAVVGRNGVEAFIELPLSDYEKDLFKKSAMILKDALNKVT